MLSLLSNQIGPSATNWLIIASVGLMILAAAVFLPALIRRVFGRDHNPLF